MEQFVSSTSRDPPGENAELMSEGQQTKCINNNNVNPMSIKCQECVEGTNDDKSIMPRSDNQSDAEGAQGTESHDASASASLSNGFGGLT